MNGDGELEWSEFTQFCVEAGISTRRVPEADFVCTFDSSFHDTISHGGAIQFMGFDDAGKEVIVVEGSSNVVKMYKSGMCARVSAMKGLRRVCAMRCDWALSLMGPDLRSHRVMKTEETSVRAKGAVSFCLSVEMCRSKRTIAVSHSNRVISLWTLDSFTFIGELPCVSIPQCMSWYGCWCCCTRNVRVLATCLDATVW